VQNVTLVTPQQYQIKLQCPNKVLKYVTRKFLMSNSNLSRNSAFWETVIVSAVRKIFAPTRRYPRDEASVVARGFLRQWHGSRRQGDLIRQTNYTAVSAENLDAKSRG